MGKLNECLHAIAPVDQGLAPAVQAHLDSLTKPPRSLGRLEDIALQYCLIVGTAHPLLPRKRIVCFAGDHGVADEGVSAFPRDVTPQMVRNMLAGGAAINVLARHAGADLVVVDMGVADPLDGAEGLVRRRIRNGTSNIARGPAMTAAEAAAAVEAGIALAEAASGDGIGLLGTGDMGIANTTPSTAVLCACLKLAPARISGRGTGLDDAGVARKIAVVHRALDVNASRLTDPLNILAALGGFEIAGICGLILGGASRRMGVIVDGFISTAAACVALKMNEAVRDYLFFSHQSEEKGHAAVLGLLNADPILDLRMRLGEGTGAALAMTVIDSAVKIYSEMATFQSAGVSNAG
jgi:nicotinate-nucleotide--dimethylbenzimidazole phosphoribosyltransferase